MTHSNEHGLEEKKLRSSSSVHSINRAAELDAKEERDIEEQQTRRRSLWKRYRPFFLAALALLILGWWISATVLPATRHRWSVHTFCVVSN